MTIKESKKQIVGCNSFEKDSKHFYRIEYVDWSKDGTYTDKNGQVRDKLVKVIKFIIVEGSVIENDKNFVGKQSKEICQELEGKSLIISTKIG